MGAGSVRVTHTVLVNRKPTRPGSPTLPLRYLDLHRDRLVILDEVQRMPDLFRGAADRDVSAPAGEFATGMGSPRW